MLRKFKTLDKVVTVVIVLKFKKDLCETFFTSYPTMFNFPFVLHSQHCFFCLKMHGALNSLVHFDMLIFTMRAI